PSRRRTTTDDSAPRLYCRRRRVVSVARDRVRADPVASVTGAVRVALAADRDRAARAVAVARRPEHDRRLVRGHLVSARNPRRSRGALHPRRAAALLDRHLAAFGSEHDPGATPRAARAAVARSG